MIAMRSFSLIVRIKIVLALAMLLGGHLAAYDFPAETTSTVDSEFFLQQTLVDGFTVPSGATVNWEVASTVDFYNSNFQGTVNGPIVVEEGGTLNIVQGLKNNGAMVVNGTVNVSNTSGKGFYSPSNAGSITINGTFAINSSLSENIIMDNDAPIVIGAGGLLSVNNSNSNATGLFLGGYSSVTVDARGAIERIGNGVINSERGTIIKNGKPYLVTAATTISDASAYANGFYIAKGSVATWNATGTVTGPIVFESPESKLALGTAANLTLGADAEFVLADNGLDAKILNIDGGGKTITLDDACTLTLDNCDLYSGADGLTISGGSIEFKNAVTLQNRAVGGEANEDAEKALILNNVTPLYGKRANVLWVGRVKIVSAT